MIKAIINADDFGMSEAFNYGVIKAYRDGVASSSSLMANMPAAEHAVRLAREYSGLFIGQHTNFVLGKPCAPADKLPSMVDGNGNFHRSGEYRSGRRSFVYEEVRLETIAQMERFKELTGHYPEHIEGHAVGGEVIDRAFLDIAKEYGIHTSVFTGTHNEPQEGYAEVVFAITPQYNDILNRGVSVDNFLNDDLGILKENKGRVVELHFHPGFLDQFILDNSTLTLPRCRDLETLCDPRVREWLERNGVELVSFGDLKFGK